MKGSSIPVHAPAPKVRKNPWRFHQMIVAMSSKVSMRMRTPGWRRIPKGEWILQQKARDWNALGLKG
jgi:hypothetical protein